MTTAPLGVSRPHANLGKQISIDRGKRSADERTTGQLGVVPTDRAEVTPTEGVRMRRAPLVITAAAASVLLLAACGDDETPSSTSSSPTAEATAQADNTSTSLETITEIVAGNPEFSTLLAAVQAAGLTETLSGQGPFTVFAPTDAAFAELPAGTLDTLLQPANQDQLAALLTYHVVPAEVMAANVQAGQVTTVNTAPFTVALDGGNVAISDGQGNQANVIKTDIDASNGVIHAIDAVLLPAQS
jgi:uncharacterized surface protein with fasciclin (FAS1) repeats